MELSAAARQAMSRLAADLTRVFGDRFVGLVAYGPTRTAAFARSIHADDLDSLTPLVDRWQRDGLDTPLLMTPLEFERSLDAFPLEYQAMLDRHEVIVGESPFTRARPSDADLRRACEVQAKAFLIHLRQGWIQAAGHAHEQEQLRSGHCSPAWPSSSKPGTRLTPTSERSPHRPRECRPSSSQASLRSNNIQTRPAASRRAWANIWEWLNGSGLM